MPYPEETKTLSSKDMGVAALTWYSVFQGVRQSSRPVVGWRATRWEALKSNATFFSFREAMVAEA